MKPVTWVCVVGIVGMLWLTDCTPEQEVELPPTSSFACQEWAVVTAEYAAVHAESALTSAVREIVRHNHIFEVVDVSHFRYNLYGTYAHWYLVLIPQGAGWIFGGDIALYCHQYLAKLAAETTF